MKIRTRLSALSQFWLAITFFFLLLLIGTFGFVIIEGWSFIDSLYMTFVSLSTVGYGEVYPLSDGGKIFTILFLTISLLTIGYAIGTIVSFVFDGHVLLTLKERKMKRILNLIKDHFIICGYGDVGRETAEELDKKKIPFVIIDISLSDSDRERNPDFLVLQEDATEETVLEKARIDKARGVISCLSTDQLNVYTVLTARQMNPELQIIAKASDHRSKNKLEKAGADRVLLPKQIAGRRMATIATHPQIIDFLDVLSTGGEGDILIESIKLQKSSSLIGTSLRDSQIGQHTGVVIIGILNSEGKTRKYDDSRQSLASITLNLGDQLIALGNIEQLESLKKHIH